MFIDSGLLLQYVVICLNMAVAFLVLVDNPRNALNRSFFIFTFGAVLWMFCINCAYLGKSFMFFRPALCGTEIMVLGFVLLAEYFPYDVKIDKKKRNDFLLFLIPWLVVFLFTFSRFIIRFLDIDGDGYLDAITGVLFPVRSMVMIWYVAWSFFKFLKKYFKLALCVRIRLLPFVVGTGLFLSVVTVCDFFLFVFYDVHLILISSLFSLIFIGSIAYSIVCHQFMDIRFVIRRGAMYVVAIFIIALAYLNIHFFLQEFLYENDRLAYPVSGVLTTAACIWGFPYLRREFDEATNPFFFRGDYDCFCAIRELGGVIYSTINLNELFRSVGSFLIQTIKLEKAIFFFDDGGVSYFFDVGAQKEVLVDSENNYKEIISAFESLSMKSVFIKELELGARDTQQKRAKQYQSFCSMAKNEGIAAIIPFFLKGRARVILLLGNKKSGWALSKKDKELLWIVSHQAGIAIENAILYDAIQRHAKELEERVYKKTERIKNMHEGQSRFLADVSHEFQTPLSILRGNIECLEKTYNKKGENEFYTIRMTLDRLSRLVGSVLNIAQLNSSKANLEKRRIDVEKLLEESYDDCFVLTKEKGVIISFSSEKCFVFGNTDKLREVLLNLISNALKYTSPGGTILLSGKTIGDEVEISVTDTGSGISRKNLPHIFERFYKIDGNGSSGTGLGLYICRQIIEAHDGTITAESEAERGSCFIIRLPIHVVYKPEKLIMPGLQ